MPESDTEAEYFARVGKQLRLAIAQLGGVCPLSNLQLGLCAGAARQEYTSTVIQMGIAVYRMKRQNGLGLGFRS